MPKFNTMPAGKYYVGDLCYVMSDRWEEVCGLIIVGNDCLDGHFNLKDGTRFAVFSTAWGDGSYRDEERREYWVDAGSIGCIRVEDVTDEKARKELEDGTFKGGNVIEFDNGFDCENHEGVIRIGNIVINTKDDDEDDEDYCPHCGEDYCDTECLYEDEEE